MASGSYRTNFQDPFVKLFGSVARVRLLRLFLFNSKKLFTESSIAARSRVSGSEARSELRTLVDSGCVRKVSGSPARYGADIRFPFLLQLRDMLLNAPLQGNDVYDRVKLSGTINLVVLSGIFTSSIEGHLDILIVGDRINEHRLNSAIKSLEADIGTELQFASLTTEDFVYRVTVSDRFVRDIFDYPHRIVFDKLDIGLK